MDKKAIASLVQEAAPIIDAHREREKDPEYYRRISIAIFSLARARSALYDARYAVEHARFDRRHLEDIDLVLSSFEEGPRSILEAGATISKTEELLSHLSTLISSTTRLDLHEVIKARKGDGFRPIPEDDPKQNFMLKPPKPYVGEVLDLMDFWHQRTGQKVVSPKGFDRATMEAMQDSTEFMRLSLSRIDPKIDTPKTITIIRNALSFDAKVRKFLSELASDGQDRAP